VTTRRNRRRAASELTLASAAAAACAVVGAPVVALAAWLHGAPGAAGAAVGVGLALVAFAGAGLLAAWARRFGPGAWAGVVAGGVAGRIALYLVVLQALSGVAGLHRPSLALATFAATVVTLAYELRVVHRDPRFFWVDTARGVAR
jgi:hypothetical protein